MADSVRTEQGNALSALLDLIQLVRSGEFYNDHDDSMAVLGRAEEGFACLSAWVLRDNIEAETNDDLVREILEAMAHTQGVSLESDVEPGRPAPNYKLALRLGIGQVFGVLAVRQETKES